MNRNHDAKGRFTAGKGTKSTRNEHGDKVWDKSLSTNKDKTTLKPSTLQKIARTFIGKTIKGAGDRKARVTFLKSIRAGKNGF